MVLGAEDRSGCAIPIEVDELAYHSSSSNPAVDPPSQIAWQHTMIRWLMESRICTNGDL